MKVATISQQEFELRDGYERAVVYTNSDFNNETRLQLMRLGPGQAIAPHHHNIRTECFKIISGTGEIRINGEVVGRSSDDIILCEPGDVHEFYNHSATKPFTFLVIRTNDPGNEDMIWEDGNE